MMLAAPGRLSMITCWPMLSLTFAPTMRATGSVTPPGGNGRIHVIGFDGNACAWASVTAAHPAATASPFVILEIVPILFPLCWSGLQESNPSYQLWKLRD